MRLLPFALGAAVLAVSWLGPLPTLARSSFAAHMTMHMAVVAVAAPLLAVAVAGSRLDPARAAGALFAPLPASVVEFVVVWSWHMPLLHQAARQQTWALVAEQGTFLGAGLLLWMAAVGGDAGDRPRRAAGVAGLLLTSMHMTLLGALFAVAPRPLYGHHGGGLLSLSPLDDQHLGGAIMLLTGGAAYLAGGVWLTAGVLRAPARPREQGT